MRKFFRLVIMVLVLVIVGVMSALTSMRVAIHGRETTVPNFAKLSAAEAERLATANGLQLAFEGQFYSVDIPEGRVVSQTPPPGIRVRRGWRVRLAQSLGPQRVVVPDMIGQSARAAELNVRQRGLELGTVAEVQLPGQTSDEIVAQSPPPNASGVQSPKLSVLVAIQPDPPAYVMPNFVGSTLSDATSRIAQAGFQVKVETAATPPPQSGTAPSLSVFVPTAKVVLHQSPAAGQKIIADTVIQLQVSP